MTGSFLLNRRSSFSWRALPGFPQRAQQTRPGRHVPSFERLAGFSITHLQFGPLVEMGTVQRSLSGRNSVRRFAVPL